MKYNLIDRAAERELAPACQQFGLSIIPYAPLHGGLLADLAVLDRDVAGDQRFAAAGFSDAEIALARELERLSRAWELAPYQVSLAWLLSARPSPPPSSAPRPSKSYTPTPPQPTSSSNRSSSRL